MAPNRSIHAVNALLSQAVAAELALDASGEMLHSFSQLELVTLPEDIVFQGTNFGRELAVYRGHTALVPLGESLVELVCLGLGQRSCERAREQLANAAREFQCRIKVTGAFEVAGPVRSTLYVAGTLR
jgi:hypothetical protein